MHRVRHLRPGLPGRCDPHGAAARRRGDRRLAPDQASAGHQVPRALHHLLQLRNLLPGADRRRASVGQEPAAPVVSGMDKLDGVLIDTDVLVVGAGAGGLMAALSAKRNGPPGTRVTLVDSWLIGRTGHTAFSNAWTIVALPGEDIDGILHGIVAGNDGLAGQAPVRQ